jgi:outer membrane cobalamin receptor
MRRALAAVLAAASAVLVPAAPLTAQSPGSLTGTVHTAQGQPVPQIVLSLEGPSGARTLLTGPEGRFRAADLAPGEYSVDVEAPGFVLSPEPTVRVESGEAHLDLVLSPAPVREEVVVTATRGEAAASTLGVSVTALDAERIREREAPSSLTLLEEVPGIATARTGGWGSQASAFVRGGESRYARILVDGVPVNQPGGLFDFGSALPLELETVEVVRGATSSLYGSDALAGTMQIVTRRAGIGAAPGLLAEADAGSFGWKRGQLGTSGRSGSLDWNLGVLRLDTDNEVPNNAFEETAAAFSGGARFGEASDLRLVLRFEDSTLGTPGQTAFGRPDLDASFERQDWTAGASFRHAGASVTHVGRIGFAATGQLSLDPEDSGTFTPRAGDRTAPFPFSDFPNPDGYQNDSDRLSLGYQAEIRAGASNIVTAGLDLERETGDIGNRAEPLLSPERTNFGAYAQDRLSLGGRAFFTLGARVERNDSFGTRFVPRGAVAFRLRGGPDATTLRASAGAGIKEPTFLESFGISFFARGNPDLEPERSRTYDLGVEQWLFGGKLRAEATAFHHEYLDQIAYFVVDFDTFEGSYTNLGKTRARGVELSFDAAPVKGLALSAQYAFLDGEVLVSSSDFDPVYAAGQPLLRRPRHQGSLSVRAEHGRVSGGLSLRLVGERADSDFLGIGLTENPGYARVDARLRVVLIGGLEAFVVAENLFDRQYQEVLGYPALGLAVRGGLRFRAGGSRP